MMSRRTLLRGLAGFGLAGVTLGGYALAEPWRLAVARYELVPPGWPRGFTLKIAVLSDLHACEPWMPATRVRQIVARTNAIAPDVVLLLGDFTAGPRLFRRPVAASEWAGALAGLSAPQGVHAILGNHDWWEEAEVQRRRKGPTAVRLALEAAGIPVYENDVVRLEKGGRPYWIAGLGDQWAFYLDRWRPGTRDRFGYQGVDDLAGTLGKISDSAPVLMMIHEPDAFAMMPDRVAVTFAGHTHGGQVTVLGYAPVVPSRYGRRYAYGHVVEDGRHLIVSGGLGCSGVPVRLGVPPEIVVVDIG